MELGLTLGIIGTVSGILALTVALFGVFLSNRRTCESNKIAKSSLDADRVAKEAEFIEKSYDLVYRSSYGKEIIEACKNHKPVLQSNQGNVSERDLENFLNELQHPFGLAGRGIVKLDSVVETFGWVIERVHDSPEILEFIKKVQTKFSRPYWQIIVDFKNL